MVVKKASYLKNAKNYKILIFFKNVVYKIFAFSDEAGLIVCRLI